MNHRRITLGLLAAGAVLAALGALTSPATGWLRFSPIGQPRETSPMKRVSEKTSAHWESLKRIPDSEVLESHVLGDRVRHRYMGEDDSSSFLKVDPSDVQALMAEFDKKQERGEARYIAFVNTLTPAERRLHLLAIPLEYHQEGALHTFFYLSHAPAVDILTALKEAGLNEHAGLLEQAIALFGPVYPDKLALRKPFFAWNIPGRRVDQNTTIPNALNPFDEKLMAISREFGVQTRYRTALERFIEQDEASRAILVVTRAAMTDDDRVASIFRRGFGHFDFFDNPEEADRVLAETPEPYRTMYPLWIFQGEMLNGSVHQFFYNSSGLLAPQVVAAMRQVGLRKHATAVERGIAMFSSPYQRRTTDRRISHFREGWTDWDDRLGALTDDVDDGAIQSAIIDLAKKHDVLPR
jgi:Domain of unknown function (DUF4375)